MRLIAVTGYKTPGVFDTIVEFHGVDEDGTEVTIGVDHRVAQDLAQAVNAHRVDGEEPPQAQVEDWQIIARAS